MCYVDDELTNTDVFESDWEMFVYTHSTETVTEWKRERTSAAAQHTNIQRDMEKESGRRLVDCCYFVWVRQWRRRLLLDRSSLYSVPCHCNCDWQRYVALSNPANDIYIIIIFVFLNETENFQEKINSIESVVQLANRNHIRIQYLGNPMTRMNQRVEMKKTSFGKQSLRSDGGRVRLEI